MGNFLLTVLLVLAAWAAWKTLREKAESRRAGVEEAARRATQAHSQARMGDTPSREAETLEAGEDGVYRARKGADGEPRA